jgi:anti-sigma B factor antagonist
MSSPQSSLRIDAEHQADAYVIQIEGELDRRACPAFDRALDQAERTRASRIIVDLEQLTFIDSIGLTTLLSASRRSAANGNRLELTSGKGYPADLFRLTALDRSLPLTDPALCPAIKDPGSTQRRGR